MRVQDKIWEIQEQSERQYVLSQKFHGMLTGKGGLTVRAITAHALCAMCHAC
jgi:hypothetical protein